MTTILKNVFIDLLWISVSLLILNLAEILNRGSLPKSWLVTEGKVIVLVLIVSLLVSMSSNSLYRQTDRMKKKINGLIFILVVGSILCFGFSFIVGALHSLFSYNDFDFHTHLIVTLNIFVVVVVASRFFTYAYFLSV